MLAANWGELLKIVLIIVDYQKRLDKQKQILSLAQCQLVLPSLESRPYKNNFKNIKNKSYPYLHFGNLADAFIQSD